MKKIILSLFIFLAACGGPAPVSTATSLPPTPTATLSPSDTPTITPSPTNTVTPTITPDPSLLVDEQGVTMRLVPAGEFTMGIDVVDNLAECKKYRSDCQRSWFSDEGPAHQVYLDAFYMDAYEVTNALYEACVTAEACRAPQDTSSYTRPEYYGNSEFDNYPVVNINWDQAKDYCEWRGGSLPTEAQWEKAARGPDAYLYPWGNQFEDGLTNFCDKNCPFTGGYQDIDDGFADTAPAGTYESDKSPYGIYDLVGNVMEWTADFYSETYYLNFTSLSSNPLGPATGNFRALRGGAFNIGPDSLRGASRLPQIADNSFYIFGFRCAGNAVP